MKPISPVLRDDVIPGSDEDIISVVVTLAHKLAVELDFHYEEKDAHHLQGEVAALQAASAALLLKGYTAPEAVHHAIEKFM